jgi:hypothetical protein
MVLGLGWLRQQQCFAACLMNGAAQLLNMLLCC